MASDGGMKHLYDDLGWMVKDSGANASPLPGDRVYPIALPYTHISDKVSTYCEIRLNPRAGAPLR